MTEHSKAYHDACAAWVDDVVERPRKAFDGQTPGYIAPQPSTHFDERMHLTLADMRQFHSTPKSMALAFWADNGSHQ